MNCIPRAFPPPLRPILLGCSPRHRPLVLLATLVGLLLWFSVYLLDLSTAGQAERVAHIWQTARHTVGTSRKPGLDGSPPKEAGDRMIAALAASPPISPPGVGARPGLRGSPPLAAHPRPPVHTLRAWVTGYDLTGITATGVPAGPGGCAVDPSVIPLGTTITIEGIGRCVANDTGGAVMGATVDIWVPDAQTAYQLTGGYTIHY